MSRYDVEKSKDQRGAEESLPPPARQPITVQRMPQTGAGRSLLASSEENAADLQSGYGNAAVAQSLTQGQGEGQPVAGAAAAPAQALIVEDTAETLEPGQMRKSEFLAQLRAAVCNTTSEALADTPWSEAGCPYIDRWFGHYGAQSSDYVERAIHRYAPESAGAASASGYIPAITARVRQAVSNWAATGEITGAPGGVSLGSLGGGLIGAVGGAVAGVATGVAGAASSVASGIGSALSAAGEIFFKEREGGARDVDDPQAIQAQLGAGQSLDGGVRSQMESAFGESLSGVQVHTDANAAGISDNLNARAFTVGNHIAFGAGEYQPGTLVGDALIAHELAHVMQQRGGGSSVESKQNGAAEYSALEDDADQAAVGAVVSSRSGTRRGLSNIAKSVMPSLRSGLRLQRCPRGGGAASLLSDQQAREAMTQNNGLGYDAETIRSMQRLVGASATGVWDVESVNKVALWQKSQGLSATGNVDSATLKAMILALVANSKYDEAIHVIVDAFKFPTTNLARIYYDSTLTGADALTSGTIATGQPQTVQVGTSTFSESYEHMIRIIGHELQHVQQRTGATPILNQDIREFLAFAWEALDTSAPALTPAQRVNHAQIAIQYYNRLSAPEKATYNATYQRLQTLIGNGGVGNP